MRRFVLAAIIPAIFLILHFSFVSWYQGAPDAEGENEKRRVVVDEYSQKQFFARNSLYMSLHGLIFGNRDKYLYFPPRILPSSTFQGRQAFSVYALIKSWNPDTGIAEVSTYVNKPAQVYVNPDKEKVAAYMPQIDKTGRVIRFGPNDVVTSKDNPKYQSLFCEGDIVEVVTEFASQIQSGSTSNPIHPVEIHLRRRLCEQTGI